MSRDPHYRLGWGFAGWRPLWTFQCNLCGTVIASRDWRRRRHFSEWLTTWNHYDSTSGEWCEALMEEWIEEGRDRDDAEYGEQCSLCPSWVTDSTCPGCGRRSDRERARQQGGENTTWPDPWAEKYPYDFSTRDDR